VHDRTCRKSHAEIRCQQQRRIRKLSVLHALQKVTHQCTCIDTCSTAATEHTTIALVGAGLVNKNSRARRRGRDHRSGCLRYAIDQALLGFRAVARQ
jgi:hypothetical protein